MAYRIASIVVLLVVIITGASIGERATRREVVPAYDRFEVAKDLFFARTAQQERSVFERIQRSSQVKFALFDSSGAHLRANDAVWTEKAASIQFLQYGQPQIRHKLLDVKNVYVLMRE